MCNYGLPLTHRVAIFKGKKGYLRKVSAWKVVDREFHSKWFPVKGKVLAHIVLVVTNVKGDRNFKFQVWVKLFSKYFITFR